MQGNAIMFLDRYSTLLAGLHSMFFLSTGPGRILKFDLSHRSTNRSIDSSILFNTLLINECLTLSSFSGQIDFAMHALQRPQQQRQRLWASEAPPSLARGVASLRRGLRGEGGNRAKRLSVLQSNQLNTIATWKTFCE